VSSLWDKNQIVLSFEKELRESRKAARIAAVKRPKPQKTPRLVGSAPDVELIEKRKRMSKWKKDYEEKHRFKKQVKEKYKKKKPLTFRQHLGKKPKKGDKFGSWL